MFLVLLLIHSQMLNQKSSETPQFLFINDLPIRKARRNKLCDSLQGLGIITKNRASSNDYGLKITDEIVKTWFDEHGRSSSKYGERIQRAKEVFKPQRKKTKGDSSTRQNSNDRERLIVCEWILDSKLASSRSDSVKISIQDLAVLLGVQLQTIRNQIKSREFPYLYLPGGTISPIGKFGSVFIHQLPPSPPDRQKLLYPSSLLDEVNHDYRARLADTRYKLVSQHQRASRYFRGEYSPRIEIEHLAKMIRRKKQSILEFIRFGPLGMIHSQWNTSFPNICVRILETLPQCWADVNGSGLMLERELKKHLDNGDIDGKEEVIRYEKLLNTLSNTLRECFDVGVKRLSPLTPELIFSLAFIASKFLDEIHSSGVSNKLWLNQSEISIHKVVPRSIFYSIDILVFYETSADIK